MKTLSEDRRALHRIPETGCRLPETAAYLRGALAEMPCTLLAPWEDAVCAYFGSDLAHCLPTTLNLEGQSYFALGYHQMCTQITGEIRKRIAEKREG